MLHPEEIAPETARPIRRDEYERMVELGLFEDEKVELLEGVIVTMSPQGPDHADVIDELLERFVSALRGRARVRVQSSYAASNTSEPEPDLAVVPPRRHGHAHPSEAYLIVEVARTTRKKDRGLKAALYAASGVEEYWVVDLVDEVVVVHRQSDGGEYLAVTTHARGERISIQRFPDVELAVEEIFG